MITSGKSVKDVVKGKRPKEIVEEVGHAAADVAFANGAEKVLKLSKKYREKTAKDELFGKAYKKGEALKREAAKMAASAKTSTSTKKAKSKPNAATEKLKAARKIMNSKN